MFKQTALILGFSLTLALAGCAQTEAELPQVEQTKTESPDADKSTQGQRPQQGQRQGQGQRPGQRPDGQRRSPPEAAYAACASLAAQSACSVETPRGVRNGVCRTRGDDSRAFCAPERPQGDRGERGEGRRPRPGGQ